jgi:formylglycine-generating enzyme required for sulfatase activity
VANAGQVASSCHFRSGAWGHYPGSGKESMTCQAPPIDDFPASWAQACGEDDIGWWMAFDYRGVIQRLRWIPSGSFMMGSPTGEPQRQQDETQHKIRLSRGYWLGETTVTQALWRAVMGKNPSHFNGDEHPVERVSWDDIQVFIDRLNGAGPDLRLRLPTEAEWEYACRAGTKTPFSFGNTISTDQANYDGNHAPYRNGSNGEYRGQTVEVESLRTNPWGLHQMHGNVWEWCQDWYGDYPSGLVQDPAGPPAGGERVLRGGSWFGNPRSLRSARRGYWQPGWCDDYTGFRLARG